MSKEALNLSNTDEMANLTDEQIEAMAYPDEAVAQDDSKIAAPSDSEPAPIEKVVTPETGDILSRDGKHLIPFSILGASREQTAREILARQDAEARALASAEKSRELQEQLNALQSGTSTAAEAKQAVQGIIDGATMEQLDAIREDFPKFADLLEAQIKATSKLEEQLSRVTQGEKNRAVTAEEKASRESQDLIDANPKLSHLQSTDPEGWEAAVALDDQFKMNPKLAALTIEERFNRVVGAYEAAHGVIGAPATLQRTEPKVTPKQNVPLSMGAIPGGTAPAVDEVAGLSSMGGTQAMSHFDGMTKEQIEAQLDRIL